MITKKTIWALVCPGCLSEYGQFTTKDKARAHAEEFPLCHNCDGEDY